MPVNPLRGFLKTAYAPKEDEDNPDRVEPDLHYLTGLEDHCYSFERRENMDVSAVSTDALSSARGGLGGFALFLLFVGVLLFIVASLAIGAFTVLKWIITALF